MDTARHTRTGKKDILMARSIDLVYSKENKMANGSGELLTITEAARLIGVSAKTIMRWEKSGKVARSKRDFRGWRVFDGSDLKKLKTFRETIFY